MASLGGLPACPRGLISKHPPGYANEQLSMKHMGAAVLTEWAQALVPSDECLGTESRPPRNKTSGKGGL